MAETEDYAEVTAPEAHAKSHEDHGSDEINVAALSGELADEQNSAWTKVSGKPATFPPDSTLSHGSTHENGGSDKINVTGLVGTTPRAIFGDATPGRVFRGIVIEIGTSGPGPTLKCETLDRWNGDVIALQENILPDQISGHFHLNAAGNILTILNTGLSGNAVYAAPHLSANASGTQFDVWARKTDTGIAISAYHILTAAIYNLTALATGGKIYLDILYITDA